jgi:hypothetical protein
LKLNIKTDNHNQKCFWCILKYHSNLAISLCYLCSSINFSLSRSSESHIILKTLDYLYLIWVESDDSYFQNLPCSTWLYSSIKLVEYKDYDSINNFWTSKLLVHLICLLKWNSPFPFSFDLASQKANWFEESFV